MPITKRLTRSEPKEKPQPPKKPPGRPRYEPTDQIRQQVSLMAACGLRRFEVYKILNMSADLFREHYAEDYELGLAKAVAVVGSKLYKTAVSDRPTALQAQQFFLKTRGGWKESNNIQLTGADGGAIEIEHRQVINADDVNPEVRDMLIEVLEQALAMDEDDAAGIATD